MIFYVYALIDPINRLPFYIGKGKKDRAWAHLKGHANYNEDKLGRIKAIRALGFEPEVKFIRENLENREALDWEKDAINFFRDCGIKLTNKDIVIPDRAGTKISETHRQRLKEFNNGKKLSEEHKKKIGAANSKSLLGKKLSNEHKANIKMAHALNSHSYK